MNFDVRRRRVPRLIEHGLALFVLAMLGRAMWVLYSDGYLPQPFFYEPSDTWMDWFNTAYWARDPGRYDVWASIYPPLSFVITRALGINSCYSRSSVTSSLLTIRDCDWVGIVMIHAIFVLNIVLIAKTYLKVDRRTALPRAIALSTGLPMVFALERGNILLLAFTCFLLGFGPLLRSARLRWFFAAAAINFKVYLIGAVAALLLKRKWLWVEWTLLLTVAIYFVTFLILNDGSPIQVIHNITSYSGGFQAGAVLDIWYSITYQPLISLLGGTVFPVSTVVGSRLADQGLLILPLIVGAGQTAILAAAAATWLRPEAVPTHRAAFLGITLALISSEAGGYAQILAIFLVFMEPWRGVGRPVAIVLCYVLCIPGDIVVGTIPPLLRDSYLAGHAVEAHLGVALGLFLRPGIMIGVAIALSAVTLRDVWADIVAHGWSRSWRYRHDAAMLPGIAPPAASGLPTQSQST